MSRARNLLEKIAWLSQPSDFYVFFYYDPADNAAEDFSRRYIVEGGKVYSLGQGRAVRFDRAHAPGGQDHAHFLLKGRSLYSLNRDGTAHDGSHGAQVLNVYLDAVRQRRPGWVLPRDGLIESMFEQASISHLIEANEKKGRPVLIDPWMITKALNIASMKDPLPGRV